MRNLRGKAARRKSMMPTSISEKNLSRGLLDVLIRAGLIAVLAIFCFRIFYPFLNLLAWSLILAVTLYPLHVKLRDSVLKRDGLVASLIVLLAILIIMVPAYLLGTAIADSAEHAIEAVKSGSFSIPPPPESVAAWPLVGRPLHDFWLRAATDLTGLVQSLAPRLKDVSVSLLNTIRASASGCCCSSSR